MVLSAIAKKKLLSYLSSPKIAASETPLSIVLSVAAHYLEGVDTPPLAQSKPLTWEPRANQQVVQNQAEIVLLATASAVARYVITWAVSDRETFPIDWIPLKPFEVLEGQKIIFAPFSLAIASDSFWVLEWFYLNRKTAVTRWRFNLLRSDNTLISNTLFDEWELAALVPSLQNRTGVVMPSTQEPQTARKLTLDLVASPTELPLVAHQDFDPQIALAPRQTLSFPPQALELSLGGGIVNALPLPAFKLVLLDIPLLSSQDSSLGLYAAIVARDAQLNLQKEVTISLSRDGQVYQPVAQAAAATQEAQILSFLQLEPLPDFRLVDFDSSLEISFLQPVALTPDDLFLVGAEILRATEIIDLEGNLRRYRLQKLVRGLKGTEAAISLTPGVKTALLLRNLTWINLKLSDFNSTKPLYFKAIADTDEVFANIKFQWIAGCAYAPNVDLLHRDRETGDVLITVLPRGLPPTTEVAVTILNQEQELSSYRSVKGVAVYPQANQLADWGVIPRFLSLKLTPLNLRGEGRIAVKRDLPIVTIS